MTTHNGWTNYATWRVNLEMFDGYSPEGTPVDAEYLEEMADEILASEVRTDCSLTLSYARAFLSEVNWQEIADAINDIE